MVDNPEWFDDDNFWIRFEPVLFNPERKANAGREVRKIIDLTGIDIDTEVLDLCCGTGRHTVEFARLGYRISGLDRTSAYLTQLQRQIREEHMKISVIQKDMRDYREPDKYDLVINLFSSFGYFAKEADNINVLKNVHASLHPGGKFLMDMMGKEILAKIFRERDWNREGDYLVLEERSILNNWNQIENRWIVLRGDRRYEHTFRLWIYSAREISALLLQSGFSNIEVYGNLNGRPYDDEAERLIVVATKTASDGK